MSTISHGMIGVSCHWCGNDSGYDLKEITFSPHLHKADHLKRFYGICGSCFQTSPCEPTKEDAEQLIRMGPIFKPEDPDKCLWCKAKGLREYTNGERSWVQFAKQGINNNHPMKALGDAHYTVCKGCQHCTPLSPNKVNALAVAESGSSIEYLEGGFEPE